MIKLDVDTYCSECLEFETELKKNYFISDTNVIKADTVVCCKHRGKCANLLKYLKESEKND